MMRLPAGYREREHPAAHHDDPAGPVYQPDVYRFAAYLARRSGATLVIDIGCGSGAKLKPLLEICPVLALDRSDVLETAARGVPGIATMSCDLESGLPQFGSNAIGQAIVICADVVEHLRDPLPLLRDLARLAGQAPYVLISTPDRDRARGWLDSGPPANAAHVREWSASEFARLAIDAGFPHADLHGHTVNTEQHRAKTTTLLVAGREAARPGPAGARVAAIVHTYNEADMLEETVRHLGSQGVEVHLFDNWSDDGTFELAEGLRASGWIVAVERFPEAPVTEYQWARQLAWTEEYATGIRADWIMHHDADELRDSPWTGVRISDALARVSALGYNAVDFTVIDFRYRAGSTAPRPPYSASMSAFEFGRRPGHFSQVKAWSHAGRVDLHSSGGHQAQFPDRRVFPLKFLMRHYPLRTPAQARRKVLEERLPRGARERTERGWHVQYDALAHIGDFAGWERTGLHAWHPAWFATEHLVERLSGLGIEPEGATDITAGNAP